MKLFITIAILFCSFSIQAKDNLKSKVESVKSKVESVKSKVESVKSKVESVKSKELSSDTIPADSASIYSLDAFRLFSPIHYDSGITQKFFSIDQDTTALLDRTIMRTYLINPKEVQYAVEEKQVSDGKKVIVAPAKQVSMVEQVKAMSSSDNTKTQTDYAATNDAINMYVSKPNFWKFIGDYSLQFMQNYISPNWYNSGNSNYSMLAIVTLQYNYNNKQRLRWDNKLEMRLGFLTTEADTANTFKSNDDLLRYTTQISLRAYKKWYYAMQLIASTQFTKGLKDNDRTVYSDFLSPFNLNLSLGMDYSVATKNKKLTGDILLAPFSYKLTYSDRLGLSTRFGIDEGHHSLHNFGSLINASLTWKPVDKFKWESRFYAYTNYTHLQIEFENTLTFQFNRYISTKLYIYPRFDDTATRVDNTYWQLKENLSIGFSYSM